MEAKLKLNLVDDINIVVNDATLFHSSVMNAYEKYSSDVKAFPEVIKSLYKKFPEFTNTYPVITKFILKKMYNEDVFRKFLKWLNKELQKGEVQTNDDFLYLQCRYKSLLKKETNKKIGNKVMKIIQDKAFEEYKGEINEYREIVTAIYKESEDELNKESINQLRDLINVYKQFE